MKVIYAGFSKCGTKSMAAALRELGMNVYDIMECYEHQHDEWEKIFREGGSTEDFRRMFEGVDAVTDQPSCFFWEQIHKAYPDAKIVYSERKEDEWWKSFLNQITSSDNFVEKLMGRLAPSWYRFDRWMQLMLTSCFNKWHKDSLFRPMRWNEMRLRMTYRLHNSYVKQNAPKDKFFVFNIKEGWEPLCKFLELPIPDTPFPHKNKNANLKNEMKTPTIVRMEKEIGCSLVLITGVLSLASWKIFRIYGPKLF